MRTYNYNAYSYNTSRLEQRWMSDNWENDVLDTFSYDADTVLIHQLQQQWIDSNWVNSMRYTYSYYENSDWTSRLKETWQNDWMNSQLITRTFDAHNYWIGELIQVWEGTWGNSFRYMLAYDNNDNRIEYIMQNWIGEEWAYYYQDNRTYDPNHFIITLTTTEWAENGIDTVLHDSTYYYFHILLDIPDHQVPRSDITLYPNPGNGSFTILCDSPVNYLEICNLSGQKVKGIQLQNTVGPIHVEVPYLVPGMYQVKLFSGRKLIGVRKVVLTGR
ncbi:MAG: T9SS type A sorting domain-containing protein, partial [Bacteroidales bacterium]|nr:T9SS type A sorting domain-containing protein [Bacteroidales bacterium]